MIRMLRLSVVYLFIAGSILLTVHVISNELFLYWRFWWLDIPVHILGGATAGLALFAAQDLKLLRLRSPIRLWQVLLVVLLLGVVWEIYELAIGRSVLVGFYDDTVSDLAMGLLGGAIAFLVSQTDSIEEK